MANSNPWDELPEEMKTHIKTSLGFDLLNLLLIQSEQRKSLEVRVDRDMTQFISDIRQLPEANQIHFLAQTAYDSVFVGRMEGLDILREL